MEAVNYFKALGDDTRLRMINILLHHELNVNEVIDILLMGQSRVSRHLKILTDNHIITCRRDGLWSFYSIAREGPGHTFVKSVAYLFKKNPLFSLDLAKAEQIIEERSKATTNFFNTIADKWQVLKSEIIGNLDLEAHIMQYITRVNTIVDLGCGTGDLLVSLKKKGEKIIGVDNSHRMLTEANKKFNANGKVIDFRIGNLEHLPLADGEADLAVINMVLHHTSSPLLVFKEINRILKKGDLLIVVDLLTHSQENMRNKYNDRWLGFSLGEITSWLQNSGFQPKKQEKIKLNKGLLGFIVQAQKNVKKRRK